MRKKVLGRGLEALIPIDIRENIAEAERVIDIDVDSIDPNPNQPRKNFREKELLELANSIAENGILQPVVVRRSGKRYQLVVGERRLRASKMAERKKVPAIVRDIGDRDSLKYALLENLQREDLNPVEEAMGFSALKEDLGLSVADIGKAVGKNRSSVANTLRLLNLPEEIKEMIIVGKLTEGHARAILSVESEEGQLELARRIVSEELTVRDAERRRGGEKTKRRRGRRKVDPAVRDLEERLERRLGTRVIITPRKKGGVLSIEYFSNDQLEGILDKMGLNLDEGA